MSDRLEPSQQITHVEIRRVQNGFVVMGLDYRRDYQHIRDGREEPQRVAYVAADVDALKNVVGSIVDGAEVKWLPTTDVPMLDMNKIVMKAEAYHKDEVAEAHKSGFAQGLAAGVNQTSMASPGVPPGAEMAASPSVYATPRRRY